MANFIVSFLIAVLSGLGIGGGGLFAVYLALFGDAPQLAVQGMNLLFFIFSAGASVTVQLYKQKIAFLSVAIMIVFGVLGVFAGVAAARVLPEEYLRRAFGIMLLAGGILSFRSSIKKENDITKTNRQDGK